MNGRLDALAVREKDGKSYFTKIGAAFPNRNGGGYSVLLDALPAPNEGQFKILLREPLPPREHDVSRQNAVAGGDRRAPADLDDELPPF